MPWITATAPGTKVPLEVTAWTKGDRTLVFVLQNVPVVAGSRGGGGSQGLTEGPLAVDVRLAAPGTDVRDERSGRRLADGDRFTFQTDATEAVFFSFRRPRAR